MRISDWSSDVCSSDLGNHQQVVAAQLDDGCGQNRPQRRRHHHGHRDGPENGPAERQREDGRNISADAEIHGVTHVVHAGTAQYDVLRQRSEEHTSELQSLMRISYAVFCLKKKKKQTTTSNKTTTS